MKFYRIINRTFICSLAFLSLTACSSSGENAPKPSALVDFTPHATVETVWHAKVGGGSAAWYLKFVPVVANDKVFADNADGTVKAFDAASGKEFWDVQLGEALASGVAADGNKVFIGARSGRVFALQQKDGSIVWTANLPGEILAAPAVGNGIVVVKTTDGQLTAYSALNGKKLWNYINPQPPLILRSCSAPKIFNDLVISGFSNGILMAFDINKGTVVWRQEISVPQGSSSVDRMVDIDDDPVVFGNTVYVAAYQGNVVAVNLHDGHIIWQSKVPSFSGLAVGGGNVYVTDMQDAIWALDRLTGVVHWQQKALLNRTASAPAIIDSAVVVGDVDGYLHFMQMWKGAFIARAVVDSSGITTQPVTRGNDLYVVSRNGGVFDIRLVK